MDSWLRKSADQRLKRAPCSLRRYDLLICIHLSAAASNTPAVCHILTRSLLLTAASMLEKQVRRFHLCGFFFINLTIEEVFLDDTQSVMINS